MKRHTHQNLFEEKVINNSSLCLSIPNTSLHSKFLASTLASPSLTPSLMLQNKQEKF